MRIRYAEQYKKACVIIEEDDLDIDDIIEFAQQEGAEYEEEPNQWAFVVQFPDRFPELYTEEALRGSINARIIKATQR